VSIREHTSSALGEDLRHDVLLLPPVTPNIYNLNIYITHEHRHTPTQTTQTTHTHTLYLVFVVDGYLANEPVAPSRLVLRSSSRGLLRLLHYLHTSAYVSIRQHTSAYVSIRQASSSSCTTCALRACVCVCVCLCACRACGVFGQERTQFFIKKINKKLRECNARVFVGLWV
jgi:hypothetical protein